MFRWTSFSTLRLFKHPQCLISSAPTAAVAGKLKDSKNKESPIPQENTIENIEKGSKSRLVTAAFASLNVNSSRELDKAISKASSPESILSLSEKSAITKEQAYKVVTKLVQWSAKGEINTDYEVDPRFISLCQKLGYSSDGTKRTSSNRANDLTMVLNVTGEDEAVKLTQNLSLLQMIKVLTSLAAKKRRSTSLLRSLSFNIGKTTTKLDVKQGADVLFSLATLNFPDEILLEKVSADLSSCILTCQKTAVIGSISTSLGLLKYKDTGLLDILCEWVMCNKELCRAQDLVSLLYTLATVNFTPSMGEDFFKVVLSCLEEKGISTNTAWLEVVWSLVVLNKANDEHLKLVLSSEFIERLTSVQGGTLNFSSKRKLLNINGAAKWKKGYTGPLIIENESIESVPLTRSKEKQTLVNTVLDALSNLLPSAVYLKTNVNTGMGFLLDGECLIDSKMTPLPLIDKKSGSPITSTKPQKGIRIAILVWDYHDFTRGKSELCGTSLLSVNLIKLAGYRVLSVPFNEINAKDKLTTKVQYLETKLKALVKPG